jgi:hypothetical protein
MKKFFTHTFSKMLPAVFLLTAMSSKAQVTFNNAGALLQGIGGTSYADCAADMNDDGFDDVVRVMGDGIYIDYQQANGTFIPAFFPLAIQNLPSWSICAGDIDENGYMDLLLGAGDAVSFVFASDDGTSYTEDAHPEYIFTQRSTFADIDNDGELDAFANHDVDQCHPYRNVDGAMVLDHTLIPTLDVGGNYAAIWVDYDNDWDTDLYITKCRGGAAWGDLQRINLLYKNNGDGTYTEAAAEANLNDGNQSWTTVFEDFDNDGDFDAFTCNHSSGDVPGGAANKFHRNNGDGTFTDIIGTTGINATDLGAWNCDAGDFDNNGFVDIFSEMGTTWYWNNGNGTFTAGAGTGFNSGGIGDFNDDGFLDVIAGNSLMLNNGNNNNYVKFDLQGIESNKSAIGARIEIYGAWGIQIREVRAGESFDPASSLITHFGLGAANSIDQVVIKWPSGTVTSIDNPDINMTHSLLEAGCVGAPVTITSNGATTICPGSSLTLTAPEGYTYTWSNGETTPSIDVTTGGNYSVVAWSEENCASLSNNISVDVITEESPEISINGDVVFCEGQNTVLTSTIAQNYTWSNGQSGQSIVVSESGDYSVSVEGLCSGVFYESNTVSVNVLATDEPVANNVIVDAPGSTILYASGSNIEWFDSENATVPVGSGNTFNTDFFDNTISYWVQSNTIFGGEVQNGGKPDNTGTGGTPATGGRLFFNLDEPVTLQEVTVYVPAEAGAGNRTIELYNGAGMLIASTIAACVVGENTITLDFEIPAGDGFQIGCAENNLFRNNAGVVFPYAIGDVGSIYNSTNGTSYYYYFYDWKVKKQDWTCTSGRVEVTATVVGINELHNDFGITVFPNPAKEVISVQSETNITGVQLQITDALGRNVATKQVSLTKSTSNPVDVSDLAPGLYHITLTHGSQRSAIDFVKE